MAVLADADVRAYWAAERNRFYNPPNQGQQFSAGPGGSYAANIPVRIPAGPFQQVLESVGATIDRGAGRGVDLNNISIMMMCAGAIMAPHITGLSSSDQAALTATGWT